MLNTLPSNPHTSVMIQLLGQVHTNKGIDSAATTGPADVDTIHESDDEKSAFSVKQLSKVGTGIARVPMKNIEVISRAPQSPC